MTSRDTPEGARRAKTSKVYKEYNARYAPPADEGRSVITADATQEAPRTLEKTCKRLDGTALADRHPSAPATPTKRRAQDGHATDTRSPERMEIPTSNRLPGSTLFITPSKGIFNASQVIKDRFTAARTPQESLKSTPEFSSPRSQFTPINSPTPSRKRLPDERIENNRKRTTSAHLSGAARQRSGTLADSPLISQSSVALGNLSIENGQSTYSSFLAPAELSATTKSIASNVALSATQSSAPKPAKLSATAKTIASNVARSATQHSVPKAVTSAASKPDAQTAGTLAAPKPNAQQEMTPTVPMSSSQQGLASASQMPSTPQDAASAAAQPREEPNGFPNFRDGNVLIVSPTGKIWKLHHFQLVNNSPVLKAVLAKQEPKHITRNEREEGKLVQWKLTMPQEPDAKFVDPEGLTFRAFEAVPVNAKTRISMPIINGMGAAEPIFNELYDNFFKCLYRIEPTFTRGNDRKYMTEVSLLVEVANYLEAIHVVRMVAESSLTQLNQSFWKHVFERPETWVHVAARMQSPLIFREAMVHIVGRYHIKNGVKEAFLSSDEHGALGRKVYDLIIKKAAELYDKKLRVERQLLEFYPGRMVPNETATHIPGRQVYGNDIYSWIALTIWRQWAMSSMMHNFHHRASDGGLAFYRNIGAGGGAYLYPETLQGFHDVFAMTSKGKAAVAKTLEAVKDEMKPIVKDLLVNHSQYQRANDEPHMGHLTCTEILDEELPWYVAPVALGALVAEEVNDGEVEMSGL